MRRSKRKFEHDHRVPTEQTMLELVKITKTCSQALVDPGEFAKVMEKEIGL